MTDAWSVRVTDVWKRYCGNLRRGAVYAISDAMRTFCNLGVGNAELRKEEFWSLSGVDFEVGRGECLAVIGRNGAGKSTLLKLLTGVIPPDRGELRVRGRLIALMMAGAGFHPMLSGRENIYIYGSFLGLSRRELDQRFDQIVEFAELGEFIDTPVKYYSSGMYVRLSYSIATQADPDVLLVDEVLAVGDIAFREKCIRHLQSLKQRGTSLLVVSHSAGQLRRLADRAIWLDRGRPILCGPASEVLSQYLAEAESTSAPNIAVVATLPQPTARPAPIEVIPTSVTEPPAPEEKAESEKHDDDIAVLPCIPSCSAVVTDFRVDGVVVDELTPIRLTAHRAASFECRLRFGRRFDRPVMRLSFTSSGEDVGIAEFTPRRGAFPQADIGQDYLLEWTVRPHLPGGEYEIRATLFDQGSGEPLNEVVLFRRKIQLSGVATRTSSPIDCRPEFALIDFASVRIGSNDNSVSTTDELRPNEKILVDEVISVSGRPSLATWRLFDEYGTCLQAAPVVLPNALSDSSLLRLRGSFFAHLMSGSYRQELTVNDGTRNDVVFSHLFRVMQCGDPLGVASLRPVFRRLTESLPSDSALQLQNNRPVLKVHRIEFSNPACPSKPIELRSEAGLPSETESSELPLQEISTGDRCRLLLDVEFNEPLRGFAVEGCLFQKRKTNLAGFRFMDVELPADECRATFEVDFEANVSPTEYLFGLNLTATGKSGLNAELSLPELLRLKVRGASATPYEASIHAVGRATVRQLGQILIHQPFVDDDDAESELEYDPWVVPDPSAVAATTEIRELSLGHAMPCSTRFVSVGNLLPVSATISAGPITRCPGFKISFTSPDRRRIASIDTTILPALMPRLEVERVFRIDFQIAHQLAPGVYDVHFALLDPGGSNSRVIARRPYACKLVVPSPGQQIGKFAVDAAASIEILTTDVMEVPESISQRKSA